MLEGIDAAAAAGLPVKVNCVVKRGVERRPDRAAGRRSSASTGHTLRFIEYMDVGHTNGWRLDDVVPGRRDRRDARRGVRRRAGRRPRTAARSRSAGATSTAAARSASSPRSRSRSAATARAPGSRPRGSSSPACSRVRGHDLRALAPRRRVGRGARAGAARRLGKPRRPLFGAPLGRDGRPAEGRDELHRRLAAASQNVRVRAKASAHVV